jgi:hypothetical protein
VKGRLSASNALLALIALLNLLSAATLAQPANLPPALVYDTLTHGPVPIPPGEKHWHGATTTTAMSPFRRSSTAKTSIGWKRSLTNNSRADRAADCRRPAT